MRIIECKQGEDAWIEARLGLPTASEFHRILTPTGKLSAQAQKYAYRLIAEILLNRQMDSLEGLEWVEHGKMKEGDAVRMYEFMHNIEAKSVGFVTTDDGRIGCSPDRIIDGNGLEIKCPSPQVHIGYLLDGPGSDYKCQVQGQLYVAEFEHVDFFSYNAEFPPVEIRTYRDEAFIKLLAQSLKDFCDMKDEMLARIKSKGFFALPLKMQTAVESEYGENLDKHLGDE